MAKMETRLKQLSQLNSYVQDVDKDVTMILQNLQWDRNRILEGVCMEKCSYNTNHTLPSSKKETHEMVCFLKSQGYSEDDQLLPDPLDVNATTLVKLNTQDIVSILNNISSWDPLCRRGNKSEPRFSEPWTAERLQSTYTADERRAIHDAVVQAVPSCHDLADLALPSRYDADESNKVKSRVEILAELRDMKRRRPKYRIAAKTRNYSDVLRDVIKTQMEFYSEMPQLKETPSLPGSACSNNREVDNTSYSTGERLIQNELYRTFSNTKKRDLDTYIPNKRDKHPKETNEDRQTLSKNYKSFNRTDRETYPSNISSKSKRIDKREREREKQTRHDDYSSSAFINYIHNKSDRVLTLDNEFRESQTQNESRRGNRDQNIPVPIKMERSETSEIVARHRQTLVSHRRTQSKSYSSDKSQRSDTSNSRSSPRRSRRSRRRKRDKVTYSSNDSESSDTSDSGSREKQTDRDKKNKGRETWASNKAYKIGNSKIKVSQRNQDSATDINIRGERFETSEREHRPRTRTSAGFTNNGNKEPYNPIKKEKIELPELEKRVNYYSTVSHTNFTRSGSIIPIKMEKADTPESACTYSRTKSDYSSSSCTEDDNSKNYIKREKYDSPEERTRERQGLRGYYNMPTNPNNYERNRDRRAIQMKTTPERQPKYRETERIYHASSSYAGNSKTASNIPALDHTEIPEGESRDRWTRNVNKDSTGNAKETNRDHYKKKNVRCHSSSSSSSSSETEKRCDDSGRHDKYHTTARYKKRVYGERDDCSSKKYKEKSNSYHDNEYARHYVKDTSESYHEERRKRKKHS